MNLRIFTILFFVFFSFFSNSYSSQKIYQSILEDFSLSSYTNSLNKICDIYEKQNNIKIAQKTQGGKVGIKIYTSSGPGLSTPINLTKAVIEKLVKSGFKKEDIFILDMSRRHLRETGYLPKLSQRAGDFFEGVKVLALDDNIHYNQNWFYDNPLPPKNKFSQNSNLLTLPDIETADPKDRKSFLPFPLLTQIDFWINLPVASQMNSIGISCSLANATLWNLSNNERFFDSPANAPIAVAEIAAIPELKDTLLFTILSLESYQYIEGSSYNANYSNSEKILWLSNDMVAIDFLMIQKINKFRKLKNLKEVSDEKMFNYCSQLEIGNCTDIQILRY